MTSSKDRMKEADSEMNIFIIRTKVSNVLRYTK